MSVSSNSLLVPTDVTSSESRPEVDLDFLPPLTGSVLSSVRDRLERLVKTGSLFFPTASNARLVSPFVNELKSK